MKKILLLMFLSPWCFHFAYSQKDTLLTQPVSCPEGSWELVFSDEFNTPGLNKDNWFTWYPYTDDGQDQCAFCRLHGEGSQIFRDNNVEVSNGTLKLIAREEVNEWYGEERPYTSGMVHSKRIFKQGRYEVRAKLPKGKGLWPAIWVYGQNEIELDILEAGMNKPHRFHTTIHNRLVPDMVHRRHGGFKDLSEDFHVYSMDWDTNVIIFAIDNKVVWQFHRFQNQRGRQVKDCNLDPGTYLIDPVFPSAGETVHFILNVTIGTKNTPFTKFPNKRTPFPNVMEVDYVRIYKRL